MESNKLKARIVELGYTQEKVATMIDMPIRTFAWKLKTMKFGTDEVKKIMEVLQITDPVPYFFS